MPPSSSFKINNFDLLRIFAASEVLAGHAVLHLDVSTPPWLIKLIYAFPGVPIFFVISGFLISAAYERSSGLKSYSRNRVLRMGPPTAAFGQFQLNFNSTFSWRRSIG